ncbi:hypothetical protein [Streptomyces sp. NPDC002172]
MPVPFLLIAGARGRWTLLATVLGSSVPMLGSTVINVALPRGPSTTWLSGPVAGTSRPTT